MHDKEEQTEIDKLLGSLSTEEALLILEDLGENVKDLEDGLRFQNYDTEYN